MADTKALDPLDWHCPGDDVLAQHPMVLSINAGCCVDREGKQTELAWKR